MTEPKRLVEELHDPSLVRALRAGIEMEPPPGAETAVFSALSAALAPGAGAPLAAPSGTKALGVFGKGFFASKWWLSVFALGLVGGGWLALRATRNIAPAALRANDSMKRPSIPAEPDSASDRPNDVPRIGLDELEREAPRPRDPSVPAATSLTSAASSSPEPVAEPVAGVSEGELVLGARKALRGGRAGEALELVEKARRDFPSGTLAQERDALEVEALARSGSHEKAREKARAFLGRYPKSPYSKNVEAVLGDAVTR